MRTIFAVLLASWALSLPMATATAQDTDSLHMTNLDLPFRELPPPSRKYNACTVTARMIDGLGFRYYWATEGLREEDLAFKPGPEARTSAETLEHIHDLALVVRNSVFREPNIRPGKPAPEDFAALRRQTLTLLKETSDRLKASKPRDMKSFNIVFESGENRSEFPFWNNLNGPLGDALWHVGQVVSFRRSSGNPFPGKKVSLFTGTVKEGQ